jgi:sugar lactone lactonase YvrE
METIAGDLGFVEGLRWHTGRLWFSDFYSRLVQSVGRDGDLRIEARVPGQPSGLGFAPGGDLMVVSTHEGHLVRYPAGGEHFVVADIGTIHRGGLNDMLTLPDGSCYISSFPPPLIGTPTPHPKGRGTPLFLVTPSGEMRVAADGLDVANGIAVTPDGRTLLVAETLANRIVAFDLASDGSLTNQRTYAALGDHKPDGISIDRQGRLWIGAIFSSKFLRLDTAGKIDREIETGGLWAVTCAVGETDDELWCGVVEATLESHNNATSRGSIMRWHAD